MNNPHKGRTGLNRVLHATGYSLAGFKAAYRGESAFRQEVWICGPAVLWAPFLGATWIEAALLAGSALLVLIVELLNSSLESAIDRISLDLHDLSKRAKDMASAAVFLSLVFFAGVWLAAIGSSLAARLQSAQ